MQTSGLTPGSAKGFFCLNIKRKTFIFKMAWSTGSQVKRVGIVFFWGVKQTEINVPLQEDWNYMPAKVLSPDLFLLSLQKFIGGRMFLLLATFFMMKCKMIMHMFVLQKHICRPSG